MEFVGVLVIIISCCTVFFVSGVLGNRRELARLQKKLKGSFGKMPQKDWKQECYANLEQYHIRHCGEGQSFEIDDITWNDLKLWDIFTRLDYTMSRAGAEVLYHTLCTVRFEEDAFDRTEEQIRFFMEHEQERIAMQLLLKRLGRMEKYSLYQYLEQLSMLDKRSNLRHHVCNAALLFAILLLFQNVGIGMLSVTLMAIVNIGLYLKEKSEIEPYLTSFAYVLNLLHITDSIAGVDLPVIAREKRTLLACRAKLKRFARGAAVVTGSSSGNPFEIVIDYIRMLFHIDLIQFNRMHREVMQHEAEIDAMFGVWGYLDTVISIGLFRASLPYYCIPAFTDGGLVMEEGYHPLLAHPVAGSIQTEKSVLLTGSNASGKSTFLKTVALNALLSQTIHTAAARHFSMRRAIICSSMTLRDNMQGGESYYIVEIKAIKRILDAVEQCRKRPETGVGVLCFVDEVLRGTNTVERIAASTQVLCSLSGPCVCCFAATHDIELTSLLEGVYDNYHFEEEIAGSDVLFSYRLLEGKATTRNAIRLLRVMGYADSIVGEAENMAQRFLSDGVWKK